MGDRRKNLLNACEQIEKLIGPIVRQSAFIETEPWGFESNNAFLNAVICCETTLLPREVLRRTQLIEKELGRTQKSVNGVYHDRPIDIDILLYDDWRVDEPDLVIPHPLIASRDFVLKPLIEIFPEAPDILL